MNIKRFLAPIFFFFAAALILIPSRANAVPAFARQTGFACNMCHFQHFPSLNQFGRAFKSGGYTMVGGQSLVEGDFLSIPVTLNASIVTKIRYQKTNGSDELLDARNRGELQFPDEGAFMVGGRVGEHIGFLLEAQFVDPDGSAWASFKMPVVYEVSGSKLSVIPFVTDAGGASYGFELLNTGSVRMHRPLEHRGETSAQQYLGTGDAATGVAFVIQRDIGYLNFSLWSPEHQATDAAPFLRYYRAALTPTVAGWDLGLGVQIWDGDTKFTEDVTTTTICTASGIPLAGCIAAGHDIETTTPAHTEVAAEAWAVDFQAQGKIGNLPLGVYFTYGSADKSGAIGNIFNSSTVDDRTAFTALAELGVIPEKLSLAIGWRDADSGAAADSDQDATTFGASYLLTQNVQFQVNHTWDDYTVGDFDGDQLTTAMIFAAF